MMISGGSRIGIHIACRLRGQKWQNIPKRSFPTPKRNTGWPETLDKRLIVTRTARNNPTTEAMMEEGTRAYALS